MPDKLPPDKLTLAPQLGRAYVSKRSNGVLGRDLRGTS
ncbi:hypothetical protein MES5069_370116 [Mesorhizobium escarrei]|uniref:Uncharacterized protein n=1 Tax=Mesorhizobium escarrei TaxID=666018 RepID=A0ABN8JZF3_9HYPH|nr:hypothetical protein MES5069_370116 [Mesorhizobium escarrei]